LRRRAADPGLDSAWELWYASINLREEGADMRWVQNGLVLHFLGCDMAVHGMSAPFFR